MKRVESVEALAVRVAVEKEQADRAKLADLLRHVWKRYLANGRKANEAMEDSADRRYYRGLATAYLDVYDHAEQMYGHNFVKKVLEDNS